MRDDFKSDVEFLTVQVVHTGTNLQHISKDQEQKRDAGKSDPMMIEEDLAYALEAVNRVLDYGKAKYGTRGGWKRVDIERYRSAHARHRRSVMQDGLLARDEESDLLHLAHEVCNGLFILQTLLAKMTPAARRKANTYNEPVRV
jgi:hypothetical protein